MSPAVQPLTERLAYIARASEFLSKGHKDFNDVLQAKCGRAA